MKNLYRVAISTQHQATLLAHLFPGDGLEAAAIILCSRSTSSRLLVKYVIPVSHLDCKVRTPDSITWPGAVIEEAIDKADPENLELKKKLDGRPKDKHNP